MGEGKNKLWVKIRELDGKETKDGLLRGNDRVRRRGEIIGESGTED